MTEPDINLDDLRRRMSEMDTQLSESAMMRHMLVEATKSLSDRLDLSDEHLAQVLEDHRHATDLISQLQADLALRDAEIAALRAQLGQ